MTGTRVRAGVTGGLGYIGSHVVRDLLERDVEVVVIDDLSTGTLENVVHGDSRFSWIEGDIRDPVALDRFLSHRPDIVFHFAGSKAAGESMIDPVKYSDNNVRGTTFLLEKMIQAGVHRFVFSSSAAVYGDPQYIPLDEEHVCRPANFYGYTKLAIEETLGWFSRLTPLRYASLRYFNAAGYDLRGRVTGLENRPQNLLPIVMEVACGMRGHLDVYGDDYPTPDGTCIRDYIHVNDLSRAHLLAMDHIMNLDENVVVNLGSERGFSVKEVLDVARRVTGRPIPANMVQRRPGDPAALYAKAGKALDLLGWKTEHSSPESIVESMWRVYARHLR